MLPHPVDNVSRSGAAFTRTTDRSNEIDLQAGERIFLRFDFPAFKDPIMAEAQVERVERVPGKKAYRVGCRFTSFQGDGESKVRRLAENVVLRGIRRG